MYPLISLRPKNGNNQHKEESTNGGIHDHKSEETKFPRKTQRLIGKGVKILPHLKEKTRDVMGEKVGGRPSKADKKSCPVTRQGLR